MQHLATKIFIYASAAFGVFGVLVVLTLPANGDDNSSDLHSWLMKLMFISVFIILPSFGLSVAGKYLNGKL